MIEASLNLDSLGQNLQYVDTRAVIKQLYNLLVMKPGTDLLNLDKGCDTTAYRFQTNEQSRISTLEMRIRDQISTYTPYKIQNCVCKALKNNNGDYILHILITLANGVNALFSTNGNVSTINSIGGI